MTTAHRTLTLGAATVALLGVSQAQAQTRAEPTGAPYAVGSPDFDPVGPAEDYRSPMRGMRLDPVFLTAPYLVRDERAWGLPLAPVGLEWVRYYDDAVLVDRDGIVREVRGTIDWDGRATYAAADARLPYDSSPLDPRYSAVGTPLERAADEERNAYWERYNRVPQGPYAAPARYAERTAANDRRGYDLRCFGDWRTDPTATIGGAVAGAVVGGIAGNLIAGRGNSTAGTLIGGGLGAVAGGVAGRELGRARDPIGPCPDDYPQTRGYGTPPIASGYGPGTRIVGYAPGTTTTTTITFDDGTTTKTTTYPEDEE